MKEKTQEFFFFSHLKRSRRCRGAGLSHTSWMSNFYTCKGLNMVCVHVHVCVCVSSWFPEYKNTHRDGGAFVRQDRNQQSKDFPQQKGALIKPPVENKEETNLSLYLYKITVTVIMLHTIYTSAKQALESHRVQHPNTMVLLMSGKIKNSHLTACKSLFLFSFFCFSPFNSVLWKA